MPLIYAKAKQESKPFFDVLDYYLNLIRKLHLRTYDYLGEMKASVNPLAYCEGGFYGGHLGLHDKIKPILKSATASFGITALNELEQLAHKKSLVEDGSFALKTMEHINQMVEKFKEEDGRLYAIYGTPAENLCGLQVQQFRKKHGVIENVSDRDYVSNSFHCHVSEEISPIEKQDKEKRNFWDLCNGGKIQYVKYPIDYNMQAFKTLLKRAMRLGFYEGVNLSLSYCDDCGHEELNMDVCPKCGSKNLTKIDRMNGYLSYSRVKGDTRLNDAKNGRNCRSEINVMNYHNITKDDMLNGEGLRVVLWLSGCTHRCPGCHNPQTWDVTSGIPFDAEAKAEIFTELDKDYISGITFSGRSIRSTLPQLMKLVN